MSEFNEGDTVQVTFSGVYRADGTILNSARQSLAFEVPDGAVIELIESADDPSRDPIGTVRLAHGSSFVRMEDPNDSVFKWAMCVWVAPNGGANGHASMKHSDIIGAVPNTPTWDAWQKGELKGAPEFPGAIEAGTRHEFKPSYTGRTCDHMVMRGGFGDVCGFSPDYLVHQSREPWTGDGSEEPPAYVRQVRDREGEGRLVRAGGKWRGEGDFVKETKAWHKWKVRAWGPFTEVRV